MKKGLLILVLVFGLFIFAGCEKKEKEPPKPAIIGSWATKYIGAEYVFTFNEDKTCSYLAGSTNMECTYEFNEEEGKLSILYKGNTAPFETTYKIEDNKLTIKDSLDKDVVYEKK